MTGQDLPSAVDLTRAQYSGWACVWCRAPLKIGAVSQGRARGQVGAVRMDVEVFACPSCAIEPQRIIPLKHTRSRTRRR